MGLFMPKFKIFKLFSKSIHYLVLKLCLIKGVKNWLKVAVFGIFKENSFYAQNEENGSFLGPKQHFLTFLCICPLDFFDSALDDRH